MQFQKSSLIILVLSLSACNQTLQFNQPPTPQTFRIAYLSSLSPLTEFLHLCISEQPESYFILEEIQNISNANQADLILWLGDQPASFFIAFPFGWENLSVVINPKNSLDDFYLEEIRSLFSGEYDNWNKLEGEDRPISVWVYPEDFKIQRQFSFFLGADRQITSLAYLASSPTIVREAIASDPGAIGFLPNAWINADLTPVQLETESLTLPILALSSTEPKSAVREFIACLQSPQFQTALKVKYQPWEN